MKALKSPKTALMLLGFALVLAAGNACFSPSSKADPKAATPGGLSTAPLATVGR